jgi:hypothetical protein
MKAYIRHKNKVSYILDFSTKQETQCSNSHIKTQTLAVKYTAQHFTNQTITIHLKVQLIPWIKALLERLKVIQPVNKPFVKVQETEIN